MLVLEIVPDTGGGGEVVAGDAGRLEFGTQTLNSFRDGGEREFIFLVKDEITDFVEGKRSGRFGYQAGHEGDLAGG